MNKFQIGDHIKGIDPGKYLFTNTNLIDAIVTEVHDAETIRIKCLSFRNGSTKDVGKELYVDSEYFDYADGYTPKPQEPKGNIFTINGQPYTNEQYVKDAARFVKEFPNDKNIELSHAIEDILIVYQYAQDNPPISNLDHYAEELGWTEEQKEKILRMGTPLPGYFGKYCSKEWWNQEYKPKKA